jgi:hypothetical protein
LLDFENFIPTPIFEIYNNILEQNAGIGVGINNPLKSSYA